MNISQRIEPKNKTQTTTATLSRSKNNRDIEVSSAKRTPRAKNADPSKENVIAPKTLGNIKEPKFSEKNKNDFRMEEKLDSTSQSRLSETKNVKDVVSSDTDTDNRPRKRVPKHQTSTVPKSSEKDYLIETPSGKALPRKKETDSRFSDESKSSLNNKTEIKIASASQSEASTSKTLEDRLIEEMMSDGLDKLSLNECFSPLNDTNEVMSEAKYKTRLFLGEANFSYTRALLTKHQQNHPNLATSIIPTAYESENSLIAAYGNDFVENKKEIQFKNGTVFYNVDGTRLETSEILKNRRIKRIHFNFPHDKSNFKNQTLPPIIKAFFKSSSNIQQTGDRIHVALPAPANANTRKFREGYVYHIYDASRKAGYNLIKKRLFGPDRYPGYKHMETGVNTSAPIAERAREYIFEKMPANASKNDFKAPISYHVYGADRNCLPEIDTDSESSSYEE